MPVWLCSDLLPYSALWHSPQHIGSLLGPWFLRYPPLHDAPPQIVHTIRGSSDAPLDVPVTGWDLRDALPGAGGGASRDAALAPVYNLQAAVVRDAA